MQMGTICKIFGETANKDRLESPLDGVVEDAHIFFPRTGKKNTLKKYQYSIRSSTYRGLFLFLKI